MRRGVILGFCGLTLSWGLGMIAWAAGWSVNNALALAVVVSRMALHLEQLLRSSLDSKECNDTSKGS